MSLTMRLMLLVGDQHSPEQELMKTGMDSISRLIFMHTNRSNLHNILSSSIKLIILREISLVSLLGIMIFRSPLLRYQI
jgi:hypothetical protein